MRKIQFANDNYYHIYNRGVDKRYVFISDEDREKLLSYLEELRFDDSGIERVEIHAFCLMDNHYHLLLKQILKNGISEFMHDIGTGYTNYFNLIHKRSGCLFEGPFKAKHINTDGYLWHLFRYIHLNPLSNFDKAWIDGKKIEIDRALEFVDKYQWSSLSASYNDKYPFIKKDFIKTEFCNYNKYQNFLVDWIRFGIPAKLGFLGA
ncbi:MAG: transposase [bacterium]